MRFASEESVKFIKLWKELHAHYQGLSLSHDEEMLKMLDLLDVTRESWSKAATECHRLNSLNETLQRENNKLTSELRVSRDKHRESQAQIASLISKHQLTENELEQYKKRFQYIKKILREQCANSAADEAMDRLKDLPFLRENSQAQQSMSPRNSQSSNTNTDEIDYDRTGDSFAEEMVESVPLRYNRAYQRRSRQTTTRERATKRRSASQQPITRNCIDEYITEEDEGELSKNDNCVTPKAKRLRVHQVPGVESCSRSRQSSKTKNTSIRRSISESNLFEAKTPTLHSQNGLVKSTLEIRTPASGMYANTWTKGRLISECTHNFEMERFCLIAICAVCNRSFSNTCYKCLKCSDCNCYVHVACRADAPVPCVPYVKTPQKSQKRRRLADLCTNKWPKLPPAIVRCVVILEKKYLNTVGLYRIPGAESTVKSLMSAFQSSIPPNLNKFDPEVICGCIKKILRELHDPLIPTSSYNEFVDAAEENSYDKLMKAIDELPVPNRHTLAFLCQHWQNVAHNSNVNQMPIENLAKCLGPTIFGSTPNFNCFQGTIRTDGAQFNDAEIETRRQVNVLLHLLKMDQSYWKNILENPVLDGFGSTHRTLMHSARRTPGGTTPLRPALIQPINRNVDCVAFQQY